MSELDQQTVIYSLHVQICRHTQHTCYARTDAVRVLQKKVGLLAERGTNNSRARAVERSASLAFATLTVTATNPRHHSEAASTRPETDNNKNGRYNDDVWTRVDADEVDAADSESAVASTAVAVCADARNAGGKCS